MSGRRPNFAPTACQGWNMVDVMHTRGVPTKDALSSRPTAWMMAGGGLSRQGWDGDVKNNSPTLCGV